MQRFGETLKQLREQKNVSQEELASRLGVTRQAVSNWERDKSLPDIVMISDIAAVFSVTVDQLLSGHVEPQTTASTNSGRLSGRMCLLTAVAIAVSIALGVQPQVWIWCGCILLISLIVHFAFSYAIKNNDYAMIAGYDPSAHYNVPVLQKMLRSIDFHTALSGFFYTVIMCAAMKLGATQFVVILLFGAYLIEFIVAILFINDRYGEDLLAYGSSPSSSKKEMLLIVVYIALLLLATAEMIFCFEKFGIQNNTPQAFQTLAVFLPNCIVVSGGIVVKAMRTSQDEKKPPHKFARVLPILVVVLSLALDVALYGLCRQL